MRRPLNIVFYVVIETLVWLFFAYAITYATDMSDVVTNGILFCALVVGVSVGLVHGTEAYPQTAGAGEAPCTRDVCDDEDVRKMLAWMYEE